MAFYLYFPLYLHGVDRDNVTLLQILQSCITYVRGNGGVANVASASQVVSCIVLLYLQLVAILVFNKLLKKE